MTDKEKIAALLKENKILKERIVKLEKKLQIVIKAVGKVCFD